MFQTYTHIQRRRGRDGSSRLEYLQGLVNDYEEASQLDVRRKILANLSNFAYDPINYEWLYQVRAAQLFIDAVLNGESDLQLQRIGMFGLCNYALDHRIQQQLAKDSPFVDVCKNIVLQRDAKYNDEFLLTTVCLLWHICTPENIALIATSDLKTVLENICSSENHDNQLHNMCRIFLDDFFVEAHSNVENQKLSS